MALSLASCSSGGSSSTAKATPKAEGTAPAISNKLKPLCGTVEKLRDYWDSNVYVGYHFLDNEPAVQKRMIEFSDQIFNLLYDPKINYVAELEKTDASGALEDLNSSLKSFVSDSERGFIENDSTSVDGFDQVSASDDMDLILDVCTQ